MHVPRVVRGLMGATAVALATAAGDAHAQNALGDGRGLQRDQRVGGSAAPERVRDFAAEVRYRNAIITGNAPGGKSFQGFIDYTDPADFRERLGSDDLFSFRRDSLFSGLGGQGLRGTEGLQYQFGLSTGYGSAGRISPLVSRAGGAEAVASSSLASSSAAQRSAAQRSWEIAGSDGTLRSTAAYAATRAMAPLELTSRVTDTEHETTKASPLLGLRTYTYKPEEFRATVPTGGVPAPKADEPPVRVPGNLGAPSAAREGPKTDMGLGRVETAFESLRQRLERAGAELEPPKKPDDANAKTPEGAPDTPAPDRRGVDAPDAGGDKPKDPAAPAGAEAKKPGEGDDLRSPWQKRMDDLKAQLRGDGGTEGRLRSLAASKRTTTNPTERAKIDRETARLLRMAGETRVTTMVPDAPRPAIDPYVEHMAAGEALMRDGKFFDAEERFARALAQRPGDVGAMTARLNAQVGSGLLLSAATNLRTLATEHPDAVGVRFDARLMPAEARQAELMVRLRENLGGRERIDVRLPRESALILAYLGYQRDDVAATREGLSALRRELAATTADQTFLELLESVWLPEAKPQP